MDYTGFLLKINKKNIILQNWLSEKLFKKTGNKIFEVPLLEKIFS
jgi:hypothetical protein